MDRVIFYHMSLHNYRVVICRVEPNRVKYAHWVSFGFNEPLLSPENYSVLPYVQNSGLNPEN